MNPERLCEPNRLEVELNRMSRMRLVAGISAAASMIGANSRVKSRPLRLYALALPASR